MTPSDELREIAELSSLLLSYAMDQENHPEEILTMIQRTLQKSFALGQQAGRDKALEEAAKIAKSYYEWTDPDCPNPSSIEIADKIRTLSEKPEENKK